jgi:hypothetical protein
LLTTLAITLATATFLAVSVSVDTTKQAISLAVQEMNARSDFQIKGLQYTFDENIIRDVRRSGGVTAVLAKLSYPARLDTDQLPGKTGRDSDARNVMIQGYAPFSGNMTGFKATQGSLHHSGAVITEDTVRLWNVKTGDTLTFLVEAKPRTVRLTAIVNPTRNCPARRIGNRPGLLTGGWLSLFP